jgi:tRNA modification GTPase
MNKLNKDTIAAISSPIGEGGIAIIRVSGPKAISIVKSIVKIKVDLGIAESHRVYHGWIIDKQESIDEVMLTIFREPNSYTGEDVIEISCHGGLFITQRVLQLLLSHGAKLAGPGEFTQRAFLHGKIDLSQAEAIADIIRAKTEISRRVAVYQLEGRLSDHLNKIREDLIEVSSLLELELDFVEEEIEFTSRDKLLDMICNIRHELKTLLKSYDRGRICRSGIKMVILGKSNVGKSSILNCILERERAIVTDIPGTTRDTVEDILDIEGILFKVVDTAGIRKTKDIIEREGIRRTEKALKDSDIVLLIFDGSKKKTDEDDVLIKRINKTRKKTIYIINKTDLEERLDLSDIKNNLSREPLLRISALKKTGIKKLIQTIKETALSGDIPNEGDVILTNIRHYDCIIKANERLGQAENSVQKNMSQEFIALDLHGVSEALGEITGKITTDDILNNIFATFCIGK